MRSLTTLVWKSEVYVHCCSQVHVMWLWLLSVTSVAKIKEKRRKESWDIHPQSSAFPVRLLRLWFAYSFTPRHHWPISTILPVNKDLEDFCSCSGLSGFLLPVPKGARKQEISLPILICQAQVMFLGEGCPPCTPLQTPGTRWGLEEARKLTSSATFRSSYLWLPMCFLREPGWSVFRNHLDMKNLKEVSAPSICERLHPVFKSGCWAPKGGHCIMQMLVPAHNVFWRKSFTARTITVPELGFKISIAVLFGIIQRFSSEPRA